MAPLQPSPQTCNHRRKVHNPLLSALLLIFGSIIVVADHQCSYKLPDVDEVITGVHLEPMADGHARVKRNTFSPLRIKIYYHESIDHLSDAKKQFINATLLPNAVDYWQNALSVRRENAPIRLDRKCASNQYYFINGLRTCAGECKTRTKCGEVDVPDEHLFQCHYCASNELTTCRSSGPPDGQGVRDADFLLYVSAVDSARCNAMDTVAYAAHCQQEAQLDRPIAGHVNICPSSISTSPHDVEVLMSTVKHEILHALGFSAGLYAFYRDADTGDPLTPRNEQGKPVKLNRSKGYYEWSTATIRRVTRTNWWTTSGRVNHTVDVVVTKRVTEEVRRHFGCDRLEGAELENQGEMGTRTTHWEKRLFENEAMTGTHTQNPVYSRLTFALMEDTGWYSANYAYAEPLHWGKGLGCDFAMQSCGWWISEQRRAGRAPLPYCDRLKETSDSSTQTTCTDTHDSLALCNLMAYTSPLPRQYQNMLHVPSVEPAIVVNYGGSVELADFCPYNQEFEWRNGDAKDAVPQRRAKTVTTESTSDGEVNADATRRKNIHLTNLTDMSAWRRDSRCEIDVNIPLGIDNAALEFYGETARCFHHAHKWVQRKCNTKRVFRFHGAGCYEFSCSPTDGLLYVHLFNDTAIYPCYHEGQTITVRRIVDGWLHEGSIVCPPCNKLCAADFKCARQPKRSMDIEDPLIHVPCASGRVTVTTMTIILAVGVAWWLR